MNKVYIKKVLLKIDKTSEADLKEKLFKDDEYIDTPGNYQKEKGDYKDIVEYDEQNMGKNEFQKLIRFIYKRHTRVRKFMGLKH